MEMVDLDTTLEEEFLDVAVGEVIPQVEPDGHHDPSGGNRNPANADRGGWTDADGSSPSPRQACPDQGNVQCNTNGPSGTLPDDELLKVLDALTFADLKDAATWYPGDPDAPFARSHPAWIDVVDQAEDHDVRMRPCAEPVISAGRCAGAEETLDPAPFGGGGAPAWKRLSASKATMSSHHSPDGAQRLRPTCGRRSHPCDPTMISSSARSCGRQPLSSAAAASPNWVPVAQTCSNSAQVA